MMKCSKQLLEMQKITQYKAAALSFQLSLLVTNAVCNRNNTMKSIWQRVSRHVQVAARPLVLLLGSAPVLSPCDAASFIPLGRCVDSIANLHPIKHLRHMQDNLVISSSLAIEIRNSLSYCFGRVHTSVDWRRFPYGKLSHGEAVLYQPLFNQLMWLQIHIFNS